MANGNCTDTVLEAIPLVRNKRIRFAIRSQVALKLPDDPRLTLIRSPRHNWEGYDYGDVLVLPQRLRATSLPMQEAMCAGMPVITTRMPMTTGYPVTRIDPAYTHTLNHPNFKRPVTAYEIAPAKLAEAIDEMAETDISRASHLARTYSAQWGWDVVGPQIKALFL
jgi:glycosyltransferase involved in cell wall biosynthesis